MRSLLFLSIIFSFSAAVVVRNGPDDPYLSHTLSARADKTPDNPDGEDDYKDPASKNSIPVSRILPFGQNGVNQPQAAKDRWFDWDMTCTDAGERLKIETAFANALMLADKASEALSKFDKLPKPAGTGSTPVKENQNYIAKNDPAYTQMWFAQDNRIAQVKKIFDTISANVQMTPDKRTGGNGGLRFICDSGGKVKDANGNTYCGVQTDPEKATQAITNAAGNSVPIEPKYVFAHSSSVVFCPVFFNDQYFPNLPDVEKDFSARKTLDLIDCRERIVLHELCHLKWTANIYQPDNIGFLNAATTAGKGTGKNRKPDWAGSKGNADNYAWYALYSYWNQLPNWNSGSNTCNNDAWPASPAKPNPTSF